MDRRNRKQNNPNNTTQSGKGKLQKVTNALKVITNKSLNTGPSPLDAPKSSLAIRPRKRALLIAVSYRNQRYELKGTINDVKKVKEWLSNSYEFKTENILILTEDEPDKKKLGPTKTNIQRGMKWLVEDCQAGDSLVFYFSGHGLRQPDFENDEIDGFDEAICPVDFREQGMITDNEIFFTIVQPLTRDVTLHGIIDACHSGTMLDLAYVYNIKEKKWDDNSPPSGVKKSTSGGLAITFSACRDDQMAADTDAFSAPDKAFSTADLKMSGALTYTLISSVKKNKETITYGELLDDIYKAIEEADQQGCLPARILRRVLRQRLLQKPQLSASEPFYVYEKRFGL